MQRLRVWRKQCHSRLYHPLIHEKQKMNTENLEEKIIQFIASKVEDIDPSTIDRSSTFETLGLDSMDRVQLLFDAEETFNVTFDDDEEVKKFTCVGDIVDYINKTQTDEQASEEGQQ